MGILKTRTLDRISSANKMKVALSFFLVIILSARVANACGGPWSRNPCDKYKGEFAKIQRQNSASNFGVKVQRQNAASKFSDEIQRQNSASKAFLAEAKKRAKNEETKKSHMTETKKSHKTEKKEILA